MKGISEWMWLIGGIISAVIMFAIAMTQIQSSMKAAIEKRSVEGYEEIIYSYINRLCWSFEGNVREYKLELGETVEGIYATLNTTEKFEGKELTNKIIAEEISFGNNLCIKIKGKRLRCERLDCNATFPFIGAVPEEFSLSLLINKLVGRGKIFEYNLNFVRRLDYVEVFFGTLSTTTTIPIETTTTIETPTTIV